MIKNTKLRIQTSLSLLILVFLMMMFNSILLYMLIILSVLSVIEFIQITKKIFLQKILKYLLNLIFIFYLSIFCFLFFFFSNFVQLKEILYILLFGCFASDIGGFLVGRAVKGPKLTKISPNKTYSGAIGSILLTCITVSALTILFTNNFSYIVLIMSISTSIGCQIGDLIFSFLKRKAKLKDTGFFLPGHGGVLDRLDGILLGIPLGFLSIIIVN